VIEVQVTAFVVVLMVAAAIAVIVRRVPVPYVTALAVAGFAAGATGLQQPFHFTPNLILFVLIPGLLFEASFNLNWRHLWTNLIAVASLATVGVLVTTVVVGLMGHFALGLAVPLAMLFGAVVSPTDPVAVVAVFRRLGLPQRLTTLVESESLLNDGTGAVVFVIALAALETGQLEVGPAALEFVQLVAGGCVLGAAIGFLLSLITIRIDDTPVEITITAIAAYGGYLAAEFLHVSGILTVVFAGLVMGNFGRPRAMSPRTQVAVDAFWDYVAFFLNSIVFLMIGLNVPWNNIVAHWPVVLAAAAIVIVSRVVTIYPLLALLRPITPRIPLRWQHMLVWSGMRGAIALALLLSLEASHPAEFDAIRGLVYGVVLIQIVVQGVTIGPVARALLPQGQPKPGPH
jgi:monovalent cation:H+ antiporter, CPA1 family